MHRLFKNFLPVLIIACLIFPSCGLEMVDPIINGYTHEVTLVTQDGEVAASSSDPYASDYLSAHFTIQAGDKYFLHLSVDESHDTRGGFTLKKGGKLYLKLNDGNLMTLENPEDVSASEVITRVHYYRLIYWDATMVYPISYDDMRKIVKSDFVGARLETEKGNLDFSINSKESKTLKGLTLLAIKAAHGS